MFSVLSAKSDDKRVIDIYTKTELVAPLKAKRVMHSESSKPCIIATGMNFIVQLLLSLQVNNYLKKSSSADLYASENSIE